MYKKISLSLITLLSVSLFTSFSYADEQQNSLAVTPEDLTNAIKDVIKDSNEVEGDNLIVLEAWARKSMSPNNNSAAYMKILNPTNEQITIIGASAPAIANNVELHQSFVDEKGISRMTSIDKIVVPARGEVELKPGGIHIMLFDLKDNISEGDNFDIMLKIEGKKQIIVNSQAK